MPEGVLQAVQGKSFTPMHLVLRRVGASLKEGKRCTAWRKGLRAIDFLNGESDAIHRRIAESVSVERVGILDDSGISTRLEFATAEVPRKSQRPTRTELAQLSPRLRTHTSSGMVHAIWFHRVGTVDGTRAVGHLVVPRHRARLFCRRVSWRGRDSCRTVHMVEPAAGCSRPRRRKRAIPATSGRCRGRIGHVRGSGMGNVCFRRRVGVGGSGLEHDVPPPGREVHSKRVAV